MRIPVRAAAVLLAALGCRQPTPEAPPLPVTVHTVSGGTGTGGPRYSASIRPDVQVDVAFKVGGYVENLLQVRGVDGRTRPVQDGDRVRRGAVLAQLRDREFRDALAQAQASSSQAKADFDRVSQLYENQSASKADYDAAYARYTSSRAAADQATVSLADATLRAPLDGTVLHRAVEVGTLVAPGTPAFTIADTRAVKVVFGVPDVLIGGMRMGSIETIATEAAPGRSFRGQITRVAPSADPTSRVFEVEVTIPNGDGALRPGMIASLQPTGEPPTASPPSLLVPLAAVVRPPGDTSGYAVFVVEGDSGDARARLRRVVLGDAQGNQIAVTAGLSSGERVILRGATLAVDSQAVRVIP